VSKASEIYDTALDTAVFCETATEAEFEAFWLRLFPDIPFSRVSGMCRMQAIVLGLTEGKLQ